MQILDMNDLFVVKIERNEIDGKELNKLSKIIEEYDNTEMTAEMMNQKSTFRIGGYKSYHLDILSKKLEKKGLNDISRKISKRKNRKLEDKQIYR